MLKVTEENKNVFFAFQNCCSALACEFCFSILCSKNYVKSVLVKENLYIFPFLSSVKAY